MHEQHQQRNAVRKQRDTNQKKCMQTRVVQLTIFHRITNNFAIKITILTMNYQHDSFADGRWNSVACCVFERMNNILNLCCDNNGNGKNTRKKNTNLCRDMHPYSTCQRVKSRRTTRWCWVLCVHVRMMTICGENMRKAFAFIQISRIQRKIRQKSRNPNSCEKKPTHPPKTLNDNNGKRKMQMPFSHFVMTDRVAV